MAPSRGESETAIRCISSEVKLGHDPAINSTRRLLDSRQPEDVVEVGRRLADALRYALALFLKKAGISSAICAAYPYTEGVGGGLSLAPNGMNVLGELSLAEKVKACGTVALEACFRSETGRVLARIDNGSKKYSQPAVTLRRADLLEVLAQEMKRQGIAVAYEKRLTDISYTSDHKKVVAHFADGCVY